MIKEGKFGVHETICILTIAMTNKIFYTTPAYLSRAVGTAGWMMTIISCISATILFTFIYFLLKRFPGKNIVEIYDITLGRTIGFIFSLSLMITFLISAGIYTREFVDVMKIYVFPNTPPSILTGALLFTVIIAAFLGLETIARTCKLGAYAALIAYILLLVLAYRYFRTANLFPILGYGLNKTIITGLQRSTAYAEILVVAVIAGSLQGIRHIKKAAYFSLLLSGILLTAGLLCFLLVFGYSSAQEVTAPIYIMARIIKFGTFFERVDPVFLLLWIISTILFISILFYSTVSIYCKMFRLQDIRPSIVPMAILVYIITLVPKDFSSVVTVYVQKLRTYGNITFFILPFIAFIVALLRRKKGEEHPVEK